MLSDLFLLQSSPYPPLLSFLCLQLQGEIEGVQIWKAHLQKNPALFNTKGPVLHQVVFVYPNLKPFTFLTVLYTQFVPVGLIL